MHKYAYLMVFYQEKNAIITLNKINTFGIYRKNKIIYKIYTSYAIRFREYKLEPAF